MKQSDVDEDPCALASAAVCDFFFRPGGFDRERKFSSHGVCKCYLGSWEPFIRSLGFVQGESVTASLSTWNFRFKA